MENEQKVIELAQVTAGAGSPEIAAHAIETLVLGGLLGVGRWLDHRSRKSKEFVNSGTLTRIENGVRAVQKEVRESTAATNRRVDQALQMLTGAPDGDGPNGHRGQLSDHEQRIRDLERGS